MLFNSIDFLIFLPLIFIIYWVFNKKLRVQNLVIVIASYVFYGWWDWRFLSLILFSTLVDFSIGNCLLKSNKPTNRRYLLIVSLVVNLGLLGFFKYYNFFLDNFVSGFSFMGYKFTAERLSIILPVGISFYTFQTLSYTIDVYRRKLAPTQNFIEFAAYVSFFPQLVAGPIERATNLLPQFYRKRIFRSASAIEGVRQIIWGLFKKVVIADNCAQYVNDIFVNYNSYSSLTLFIGGIYFAFQIYGDFSGYSDIAIGTAKLFGFRLMKNFSYPYFSRDIAEFWRKWHISLSTWFRDYLYIPLGGSRGSKKRQVRNTLIIFTVSGFWHGANWTFIVWGVVNALCFLPLLLGNKNRVNTGHVSENSLIPSVKEFTQISLTFFMTTIAWIFFRSASVSDAFIYLYKIALLDFSIEKLGIQRFSFELLPLILLFITIEWFGRKKDFPLREGRFIYAKTLFILVCTVLFGSFSEAADFIYFQF